MTSTLRRSADVDRPEEQPAQPRPVSERMLLLTLAISILTGPWNFTMLVVALPVIVEDLNVSLVTGTWIIIAPMLVSSSLQSIGGRLGDLLGYRRMLFVALLGYGATTVGAAVAPVFWVLLLMRCLQVTFGGATFPNSSAIIRVNLPPERRATAFGAISAALSVAAAAGPAVGGILAASLGWRAIFVANLPITIAAFALALRYVPPDPVRVGAPRFRIDVLGALLLICSISSIAAPLQLLSSGYVTARQLPWIYAGSLLCVAAFILWEARQSDPLIQVRLYLVGSYRAAVSGDFLAYIAQFPITVAMSIFLQDIQDRSAIVTGLVLSFGAIGAALIAPFGGRLADRMGRRAPILIGRSSSALGLLLLLLLLNEETSPFLLAAGLTILSLGGGLATAASQAAAVESAPREFSGMAAGVAATTGFLGGIVGTTISAVYLGESPEFGQFQLLLAGFCATTVLAVAVATRVRPWPGETATG